jgi:hypothetical protein
MAKRLHIPNMHSVVNDLVAQLSVQQEADDEKKDCCAEEFDKAEVEQRRGGSPSPCPISNLPSAAQRSTSPFTARRHRE